MSYDFDTVFPFHEAGPPNLQVVFDGTRQAYQEIPAMGSEPFAPLASSSRMHSLNSAGGTIPSLLHTQLSYDIKVLSKSLVVNQVIQDEGVTILSRLSKMLSYIWAFK